MRVGGTVIGLAAVAVLAGCMTAERPQIFKRIGDVDPE